MSIIGMENEFVDMVIVAMIIFYLKHIGNKLFEAHEKNKLYGLWMKVLQINICINECVGVFEQIISQETWPKFNKLINYFGLIFPIIFYIIINNFSKNPLKYFVYLSWFFIIISILIFAILPYLIGKINQTNMLVKARITEIWILTAKFFIFNSFLINILILLFLPFQDSQTSSSIIIIEKTVNILVVVLMGSMVFMKIIHRDFLDKIKTLLNTQHMADYPFIHITTKEADFAGKIQDAFNKNLLILDDNGRKTIVEWNEITTMELLKEESEIDHSPPPSSKKNP